MGAFVLVLGSLLIFFFIFSIPFIISWETHAEMTKDSTSTYGYGTYKDFVKEFNKVEWVYIEFFSESLFGSDASKDKIHAGIIFFNSAGMVIRDPFSYFLAQRYVSRHIKHIKKHHESKRVVHRWR